MDPSQGPQLAQAQVANPPMDFGILGEMLIIAYRFQKSRFMNNTVSDPVAGGAKVELHTLFVRDAASKKWILRQESVPGDLNIKAIAVDATRIYVETSLVDRNKIEDLTTTYGRGLHHMNGAVRNGKRGRIVVSLADDNLRESRSLWFIWTTGIKEDSALSGIAIVDGALIEETFVPQEQETATEVTLPTSTKVALKQVQTMNLVQTLIQEQTPQMLLRTEGQMRPEMALQMQGIFALGQNLLRMTPEERLKLALSDPSPEGQARFLRISHFALTGQVKKVTAAGGSTITWATARKIAWKLINKRVPGKVTKSS